MAWTDKIFAYCERAGDPAFWAEPFNAISNVAFLIAALAGAVLLVRTPNARERRIEWGLVLLVTIIGIGSFLFHTYATRVGIGSGYRADRNFHDRVSWVCDAPVSRRVVCRSARGIGPFHRCVALCGVDPVRSGAAADYGGSRAAVLQWIARLRSGVGCFAAHGCCTHRAGARGRVAGVHGRGGVSRCR